MDERYLIANDTALELYRQVRDLPIYDYHCHLSPKAIFEDEPFDNIGQMWLGGDHYKWRLMRQAGVPERQVTGLAPWQEKFRAFAGALERAAGNPLYHWSKMELSMYFGVEEPLTRKNADAIWEKANETVRREQLSPRKLILRSGVKALCTTDDPADSLEWHEKLAADGTFPVKVLPSFRTDNAMLMCRRGYDAYLKRLGEAAGVQIRDLRTLKEALSRRLDFFVEHGCVVTDVGTEVFPDRAAPDNQADVALKKALQGKGVTESEYLGLVGNLFKFLGGEYRKRDLVMQWHMASMRNINTPLMEDLGPDTGGDVVGDPVPLSWVAGMLDEIHRTSGLPRTILYTLNPVMFPGMAAVAGTFPGCVCGTAWWFCDHKRGIENAIETIAEESNLSAFLGMLTDSRSFLSYARHDYFRRIFCSVLGRWIERGEFPLGDEAVQLAKDVCCGNTATMLGLGDPEAQ